MSQGDEEQDVKNKKKKHRTQNKTHENRCLAMHVGEYVSEEERMR
jgi:hypothetical protein